VDCVDRITTRVTEQALEPIRKLAGLSDVSAVTVRTAWMKRRFEVTVRKGWLEGSSQPPSYGWELHEVEESGAPVAGGLELSCPPAAPDACADAEEAYWTAIEALQENVAAVPADAPS
jgi:hypothetical protein